MVCRNGESVRYEKAELVHHIALAMMGTAEGLSLGDIRELARPYYDRPISKKTAERLRNAIGRLYPSMFEADRDRGDRGKRWRVPANTISGICITAPELADLEIAAALLEREHLSAQAQNLRLTVAQIRALTRPDVLRRAEPDLEALAEREHVLSGRQRRPCCAAGVFELVRHATIVCRRVMLHREGYGESVEPYGLVYGCADGPYLVGRVEGKFRHYALCDIERAELGQHFARQSFPHKALEAYAKRHLSACGGIGAAAAL